VVPEETGPGITYKDVHTVTDQAERLGIPPEVAYAAAIAVLAEYTRHKPNTDGRGPDGRTADPTLSTDGDLRR
jgi:hypothetical protein